MKVEEAIQFFAENQYQRPAVLKKNPQYEESIATIAGQLAAIAPDAYKRLPAFAQVEVLSKASESCDIFPHVKGTDGEATAFNIPLFRQSITQGVCERSRDGHKLTVTTRALTAENLLQLFQTIEEKQSITALDISECPKVRTLVHNGVSLLQDFGALQELTLPTSIALTSLSGIEAAGRTIETLDLSNSGIETLDELHDMQKLQSLKADGCGKLKDINGIRTLPISNLSMAACSGVSYEMLKAISTLQELRTCNLAKTASLTDLAPFAGLPHLEKLTVPATTNLQPQLNGVDILPT